MREKAIPLFTTKPELERSGMGFAFDGGVLMDKIEVTSVLGGERDRQNGKNNPEKEVFMEHTIALIKRSHEAKRKSEDTVG